MFQSITWLDDDYARICAESPIWHKARQDFGQNLEQASAVGRGFIVGECQSTFDALLELPVTLQAWDWLIACRQSRGRGQYGRHWNSPLGNLCVSQVLPNTARHNSLLPMLLAKIFAEVLCRRGFMLRLKWPNDLLLFSDGELQGKVGGLLLEQKQSHSVLGFGLNLMAIKNEQLPALPAAHVAVTDLLPFWAECSKSLQQAWLRWRNMSAAELRDEIEGALAFLGQEVEFFESGNKQRGILLGISEHGELRLETSQGVETKRHGFLGPLGYNPTDSGRF